MTESEKERFGKSAMVRYVSGIDQPIYPIAYIKNKIPMAKKTAVCSYTADGRALIHTNLRRDNPKFCVTAKSGANREKFIMGGRRVKRLPPC